MAAAALVAVISFSSLWACERSDGSKAAQASVAAAPGTVLELEGVTTVQNLSPVDTQLTPGDPSPELQAPEGQSYIQVKVKIANHSQRAWVPTDIKAELQSADGQTYDLLPNFEKYIPRESGHFLAPGQELDSAFIFQVPEGTQAIGLSYSHDYDGQSDTGELKLSS